ncbi:hypothetical protein MJO28_010174 [Puccinia striiformis f. sp. tritici]|uniref:Uncharacterized protein n=1 Tax=Puccinia striiformis f. sp. tritici TaxID=168172 RepID=A0ACC0E5T0_9BASI|nr:hypothetical protein MJO28_010174 [Puccinia striiformis f. sp. tritici]
MSLSLDYPHSNLQPQFSSPSSNGTTASLVHRISSSTRHNVLSSSSSPSTSSAASSSSASSPSNLLTVPETRTLLMSPSPPPRPARNPWRHNQASSSKSDQTTTTSNHHKHQSTNSLISILEHPSDYPNHNRRQLSQSSTLDHPPTRTSSRLSHSPDSFYILPQRSQRRHSSALSPLRSSQSITPSTNVRRPISFHQQNLHPPPAKSTSSSHSSPFTGSFTKLLSSKLNFLSSRKTHVPPSAPSWAASISAPSTVNRLRSSVSSSPSHQTTCTSNPVVDDSEEGEYASADEGDEGFWKLPKSSHIVQQPATSARPAVHRSPSWSTAPYTDPTLKRLTRSAEQSLTRQDPIRFPDTHHDASGQTGESKNPRTSQSTSNRASIHLHSSLSFASPTRFREPSTKTTPAEFRAGRVFMRSSQIFADQTASPSLDSSTVSVQESEQDQTSTSSIKPITPSSHHNQVTTTTAAAIAVSAIYPLALASPSAEDEDTSFGKDSGILSRISEPFSSFLSPANSCVTPRRSPSSNSLAHRFNSGVLSRSSGKSTPHKSINHDGLPSTTSRTPTPKKTISMTFSLRHVPKFLNQRAKLEQADEKSAIHAKQSDVHVIIPNLPHTSPNELPATWRSMVSPDGFLRLEERYGALEMKRQELIWELCRTEFGYVESLKMIIGIFLQPLKKSNLIADTGSQNWLDIVPGSIIDLFENLEEICKLHQEMCESILDNQDIHHIPSQLLILDDHQAATEDDHLVILKISETFQNFIGRFNVYQNYLIRFQPVHHLIDQLIKDTNSPLGAFIRARSELEECGKMSFNSFLLKPVQRLMKYPLFFKQLCDVTPISHPDHLAGQQLWKSTDETIRELEQVKMREEELETLKLIESQITGLAENFKLADGKRKLVRQGFVRRVHAVNQHLGEGQSFTSDDDDHHHRKASLADLPRPSRISTSSRRSSSTVVENRLRGRPQYSDDWCISDHTGLRSSIKSTFSSACPTPTSDHRSRSPQRFSKPSSTSLKSLTTNQEHSSLRLDSSHRHHPVPLPALPGQQVPVSLPGLSSSVGPTISRPKQLSSYSSSSKTKVPQPKMTLNPKLSLKSIDSKLDSLSTHHHHHQSGKQRKGSLPDPTDDDQKLKPTPSCASITSSTTDRRRVKKGSSKKIDRQQNFPKFEAGDLVEYKEVEDEENLHVFIFSDGLVLLTRPLHDPIDPGKPGHPPPQRFKLVNEINAVSSLLGFQVVPPKLHSDRYHRLPSSNRARNSSSDRRLYKRMIGSGSEVEKENTETSSKDNRGPLTTAGAESVIRRGRKRRIKPGSECVKKCPYGRVEIRLKRLVKSYEGEGDENDDQILISLGLPIPLPGSISHSVYYCSEDRGSSLPLLIHNLPAHHQKLAGDLGCCSRDLTQIHLPLSELLHSLTTIIFS